MPYLTPNAPVDSICRGIVIPIDDNLGFLPAVNGALLELTYARNWEKHGDLTPEQCAEYMRILYDAFTGSDCDLVVVYRRIFRFGVNGKIQFSDNGGDSWSDAEEQLIAPLPPRPEPTTEDKRCLGAVNAANTLRLVYLELLDAYNTDSEIQFGIAVFAAILGLLLAGLWLPVAVITALINFALGAFGYAWVAMEQLGIDDWTIALNDDLICLLYENATVTAGVVTFDFNAVRDNVMELDAILPLKFWLFYILQIIGAEGLNAAGATTAETEGECDACGTWCVTLDFGNNDWDFEPFVNACGPYGTVDGSGWRSIYLNGSTPCGSFNQYHQIFINRPLSAHITRVDVDITMPAGGTRRVLELRDQTGIVQSKNVPAGRSIVRFDASRDISTIGFVTGNFTQTAGNRTLIHSATIWGTGENPFGFENCGDV